MITTDEKERDEKEKKMRKKEMKTTDEKERDELTFDTQQDICSHPLNLEIILWPTHAYMSNLYSILLFSFFLFVSHSHSLFDSYSYSLILTLKRSE